MGSWFCLSSIWIYFVLKPQQDEIFANCTFQVFDVTCCNAVTSFVPSLYVVRLCLFLFFFVCSIGCIYVVWLEWLEVLCAVIPMNVGVRNRQTVALGFVSVCFAGIWYWGRHRCCWNALFDYSSVIALRGLSSRSIAWIICALTSSLSITESSSCLLISFDVRCGFREINSVNSVNPTFYQDMNSMFKWKKFSQQSVGIVWWGL